MSDDDFGLGGAQAMAKRKMRELPPSDDRRKLEVWKAAEQIWAENEERVALRNVWARVKRNAGVAGNNKVVGGHLAEWMEHFEYSPIIETADMPDAVQGKLAKAGVELWHAAQAEAARIWERESVRHQEALAAERGLRDQALGMLDARDAVIESLRKELDWYAERERLQEHAATARSRAFWRRVAQEIWHVLPENGSMHLTEIARSVAEDTRKEALNFTREWVRNRRGA